MSSRQVAAPARYDRKTGKGVKELAVKEIGIIVNGATGRIASTQHLANALVPIRAEGGLTDGADRIVPRLLLVGRNAGRLAEIARTYGVERWTTNLDEALTQSGFPVFFDGAATKQRVSALTRAISAGQAYLHRKASRPVGSRRPVVVGSGAFARAQARRGRGQDFSAWFAKTHERSQSRAFSGASPALRSNSAGGCSMVTERPSQRPSWNYQRSGGGGLTSDMYPHWRYVIERISVRFIR